MACWPLCAQLLAAWLPPLLLGLLGLGRPREGVPLPSGFLWTEQRGVNCYAGMGATDLEWVRGQPCGTMSLVACQERCDALEGCQGVTVSAASDGLVRCYRRGDLHLDRCLHGTLAFDTWIRGAVSGSLGCGVAIAGDWPTCGAQFSVVYHYDLNALMRNAQAAAGGPPLWRYDWRASEHPHGGPWTYVAMDWCPHGGLGEAPDPEGPSPGLLGWNEPNVPGQCNQAAGNAGLVAEFVALARRFKQLGKFVVSPAPSQDAPWLDTFLGVCKALGFFDVDYLAYHHYVTCNSNPATSGDAMYGELSSVAQSFVDVMDKYNAQGFRIKGLWITEIACAPDGGWANLPYRWAPGKPSVLMGKFVDLLRNYPQIKTWSWFGYEGFGQLWQTGSGALTDLGRTYFGNCHPHGQRGVPVVDTNGTEYVPAAHPRGDGTTGVRIVV